MHDPITPVRAVSWRLWDWEAAHMHLGELSLTADPASDDSTASAGRSMGVKYDKLASTAEKYSMNYWKREE